MRQTRIVLLLALAGALALPTGCSGKPAAIVADDARRQEIIEALIASPDMRLQVIERLVSTPGDRAALFGRIVDDDDTASQLTQKLLESDRGKALVASRVAADTKGAMTFVRMLMLTGVMGPSLTQPQAEALGLGDVFAYGNQRRTMADIKRLGQRVEALAKEQQGRYPVCFDFSEASSCLAEKVPAERLQGLSLVDAWGTPIVYRTDREGTQYVLMSYATDRVYDGAGKVGPTESFNCDIVFSNGDFIQWPGRIRKADIR
jgi:hypothetical protein